MSGLEEAIAVLERRATIMETLASVERTGPHGREAAKRQERDAAALRLVLAFVKERI